MGKPAASKVPPTAGYTYTADGRYVFTKQQMSQFVERMRWAVLNKGE